MEVRGTMRGSEGTGSRMTLRSGPLESRPSAAGDEVEGTLGPASGGPCQPG